MFRKLKCLLIIAMAALGHSCAPIYEDLDRCEVYLQFLYDYNMEYVCSFTTHVPTVDVLVFDADGKYLFTKFADCPSELTDGNKMLMTDDLQFGTYKVLAVGGLTQHFAVSHFDGLTLTEGVTTIEQVHTTLARESESIRHELSPLWVSEVTTIDYTRDLPAGAFWTVPLMKYTNHFNVSLYSDDHTPGTGSPVNEETGLPLYTFEIVTPEGAVYQYDHTPVLTEGVTYHPYALNFGSTEDCYAVANLSTVRLIDYRNTRAVTRESGYRLIVRNTFTLGEAWNVDLINLLENFKPEKRPDGSPLSIQEFLDRKSEWDIAVLHREGEADDDDTLAILAVKVGPWIKWLHEMDLQ